MYLDYYMHQTAYINESLWICRKQTLQLRPRLTEIDNNDPLFPLSKVFRVNVCPLGVCLYSLYLLIYALKKEHVYDVVTTIMCNNNLEELVTRRDRIGIS